MIHQLIYPWDAKRTLDNLPNDIDSDPEREAIKSIFTRFEASFKKSPEYFYSLKDTKSHEAADAILAYIFRDKRLEPKWFTSVYTSFAVLPYMHDALKLACLTFSLTTSVSTGFYSMFDLVKAYREQSQDDGSFIFEQACDCGLLVITGIDSTFFDTHKVATVFSILFQSRIATPGRRTILLLEIPDVFVNRGGNATIQASDLLSSFGTVSVPNTNTSDSAMPMGNNITYWPDKADKAKTTAPTPEQLAYFKSSVVSSFAKIQDVLSSTLAQKVMAYADSMFFYATKMRAK